MTKPCPNANPNGSDAWRHGPAQDWTPCPLSELDGLCNCCEQCERNCAMEAERLISTGRAVTVFAAAKQLLD